MQKYLESYTVTSKNKKPFNFYKAD